MVMNQGRNAKKVASGNKFFTIHYSLFTKNSYFCRRMNKSHRETISIRFISTAFMILAIAIFKPFGLEAGQWQAYLHLLSLFMLGLSSCFITEVILRYIVRMPRSYERGINYIISRNLRFQLINTPLVALLICLYRHIAMSSLVESNRLSLSNYLETLAIIAFLSFAIGLYWRFKFRSKYLAMELEETRLLNEELKKMQEKSLLSMSSDSQTVDTNANSEVHKQDISAVNEVKEPNKNPRPQELTLTGTTNESVTLQISYLLYIEAVGNYVKVCHLCERPRVGDGTSGIRQVRTDMLRATMKQMEETLQDYPMIVRCHRAFIVNLDQVKQIVAKQGSMQLIIKHSHDSIPVSRSNVSLIKDAIKNV